MVAVMLLASGLTGYAASAAESDHAGHSHAPGLGVGHHDHDDWPGRHSSVFLCQLDDSCGNEPAHSREHVHVSCCVTALMTTNSGEFNRFAPADNGLIATPLSLPISHLSYPLLRPPRIAL
jgi:hypothetical protein